MPTTRSDVPFMGPSAPSDTADHEPTDAEYDLMYVEEDPDTDRFLP